MRKIYFLFLLVSAVGFSQEKEFQKNIDSLFTVFEKKVFENSILELKDVEKIKVLLNKVKTPENESKFLYLKSLIYLNNNDLDEVIRISKQGILIATKTNNTILLAKLYLTMGRSFERKSDFVNSIFYYKKAVETSEKNNLNPTLITAYRGLSMNYLDHENNNLSLLNGKKALEIAEKTKNLQEIANCFSSLGEINRIIGNNKEANMYFQKGFDLHKKNNSEKGKAWVLTNWSLLFEEDIVKSLQMEIEAQKIWDKIEPENMMSFTNIGNMAWCYENIAENDSLRKAFNNKKTKLDLYNDAIELRKKSILLSQKSNNSNSLYHNQTELANLQYKTNEFKSAFQNLKKGTQLKDSLFSQENKNKIAKLESAKEIELRDKEIKINKLAIVAQQKQKWFYILGIGSLAILGGLLFYQSRNRKKNNEKLQVLNSELDQANKIKTRFFSILNHDLRSPVSNLIHFLHLQQNNPELLDEETKTRMQTKTITGAENLLSSMEDILLWSKGQMENFKPQPKNIAINQLFDDTKKVFSGYLNIKFEYQNPDNLEIFTDENYLKTIVRNLTSNAINVFTTTQNPTIVWKAWQESGKSYLSITDNGSGASKDNFKALYDDTEVVGIKTGLGLHLIRDLAKAIDCEISVDSKIGEGTTFVLKLK